MNFVEEVEIDGKGYTLENISLKNNIFLNYCYDEANFGRKRLFQKGVDIDMYLYDEIIAEIDDDDELNMDDDTIKEMLRERLTKKYDGLLSDEEIVRKMETILHYNGEYNYQY